MDGSISVFSWLSDFKKSSSLADMDRGARAALFCCFFPVRVCLLNLVMASENYRLVNVLLEPFSVPGHPIELNNL